MVAAFPPDAALDSFRCSALDCKVLWHTTISVSSGMESTAQLLISASEPARSALFLNFVAPNALEPIPASQANIIFKVPELPLNSVAISLEVSSLLVLLLFPPCRMIGSATIRDTMVAIRTPQRTRKVSPFGAIARIAIMLPGDAGATNPTPKMLKNSRLAALPAISASSRRGLART